MTTQHQINSLLNSDAVKTIIELMCVITGGDVMPMVNVSTDPPGVIVELNGPFGRMRTELFPGAPKVN